MGVRRMICGGLLLFSFLALFAVRAIADTEVPLFSAQREACDINATATLQWRTIIFRIQPHQGAAGACVVTQGDTLGLIDLAFDTLARNELDAGDVRFQSIFLGRLIDNEWLSRHLSKHAELDADWSAVTGRSKSGERAEAYVQRALEIRAVLDPIDEALKPYGYRAGGFSCEKAMISGPDTKPFQPAWVAADKRLPFDALCHLVLKPLE